MAKIETKWMPISNGTVDSFILFLYEGMVYSHSKEWIQAMETDLEGSVPGAVEWKAANAEKHV